MPRRILLRSAHVGRIEARSVRQTPGSEREHVAVRRSRADGGQPVRPHTRAAPSEPASGPQGVPRQVLQSARPPMWTERRRCGLWPVHIAAARPRSPTCPPSISVYFTRNPESEATCGSSLLLGESRSRRNDRLSDNLPPTTPPEYRAYPRHPKPRFDWTRALQRPPPISEPRP